MWPRGHPEALVSKTANQSHSDVDGAWNTPRVGDYYSLLETGSNLQGTAFLASARRCNILPLAWLLALRWFGVVASVCSSRCGEGLRKLGFSKRLFVLCSARFSRNLKLMRSVYTTRLDASQVGLSSRVECCVKWRASRCEEQVPECHNMYVPR